jgi:ATP-dependent exoDNAse (exonuclease V) alpha subunit
MVHTVLAPILLLYPRRHSSPWMRRYPQVAWAEQQAIKEVMVFLQGMGVSTSLGVRIYKTYRDEAIQVVRREPYRLAADVWGIGFKTADQIAQRLGIPHDSPERVKAGLHGLASGGGK